MKEKTIKSTYVFRGRIVNLRVDEVSLDSGRRVKREVVEHPGSVAVVPILDNDRVVMVKQYRYAVGYEILELPAGTMNGKERPLECARRELLEETGYRARSFRMLGSIYLAPGYCNELIRVYLAEDLKHEGQMVEEDEEIRVVVLSWREALHEVLSRRFYDAKTLCGLFLARNALEENDKYSSLVK